MFSLLGLCTMLFFLYLRPQEAIPSLQSIPALNLCAALGVVGLAVDIRLRRAQVEPVPSLRWMIAVGLWGVAATAVAAGGTAASAGFSRLLIPFIVYLLVSVGVSTFRSLQAVLTVVLLLGLSIAFVGVHQGLQPAACYQISEWSRDMAGAVPDGRPCEVYTDCYTTEAEPGIEYMCERPGLLGTYTIGKRVRYRGTLNDPNEVAMTVSVVIPIAFAFMQLRSKLRFKLLAALTVGMVGMCTIFTQSRGGQLVFLSVLGVYFIRRFGLAAGGIAGALGTIPILLLGGRSGEEAEGSALERAEALYAGIEMIRTHPLFGVGITQFVEHHFITAHNSYLLACAELGVPGLFLWLGALYISIKTLILALLRYDGRPEAEVAATWAMALLACFTGMCVGIFFLSFSYHVVLFIYLGLAGAFYQACKRHDPSFEVPFSLMEGLALFAGGIGLMAAIGVVARIKTAGG